MEFRITPIGFTPLCGGLRRLDRGFTTKDTEKGVFPWPGENGQGKEPPPPARALLAVSHRRHVATRLREPARRAAIFCPIAACSPGRKLLRAEGRSGRKEDSLCALCALCGEWTREYRHLVSRRCGAKPIGVFRIRGGGLSPFLAAAARPASHARRLPAACLPGYRPTAKSPGCLQGLFRKQGGGVPDGTVFLFAIREESCYIEGGLLKRDLFRGKRLVSVRNFTFFSRPVFGRRPQRASTDSAG
jgi:hypothetical protein